MDRIRHVFHGWESTGNSSSGLSVDWREREVAPLLAFDRPDWEDTLKFTGGLKGFSGRFGVVPSGLENCADVNNLCLGVSLVADRWHANPGCKYHFTVKGGSRGIRLAGLCTGKPRECHVDGGNWSDQSHEWVRDWELDLRTDDGSPIIVRCLAAEKPRLAPGSGPYLFLFPKPGTFYHVPVVKVFNEARRIGLFR